MLLAVCTQDGARKSRKWVCVLQSCFRALGMCRWKWEVTEPQLSGRRSDDRTFPKLAKALAAAPNYQEPGPTQQRRPVSRLRGLPAKSTFFLSTLRRVDISVVILKIRRENPAFSE